MRGFKEEVSLEIGGRITVEVFKYSAVDDEVLKARNDAQESAAEFFENEEIAQDL